MNPFYNAMGGANPFQLFQQFRQNPMQFMAQRRMNVPQGMMGDPNAMINHLVQSGQISQQQLEQAKQTLAQMQGKAQGQNGTANH